ncbi:MAG TPA: phosphoribosylanthranilate isomerase [Sphingopyxis sp.]|nr:phosphoribosylanthranilate isomerase [Sphingopyxis sp.]
MPPLVKICGLSTSATIDAAIGAGASHIGLVHFQPSPRHLSLPDAARLRQYIGSRARVVLLLVDPTPALLADALTNVRPDILQFHGDEAPERLAEARRESGLEIWKAIGLKSRDTLQGAIRYQGAADLILYDAPAQALPGGNGTRFDWSLLRGHRHLINWGLAGGLTPNNIADAIAQTGAPLVDVSSGVESAPGVKDMDKIAALLKAARR